MNKSYLSDHIVHTTTMAGKTVIHRKKRINVARVALVVASVVYAAWALGFFGG